MLENLALAESGLELESRKVGKSFSCLLSLLLYVTYSPHDTHGHGQFWSSQSHGCLPWRGIGPSFGVQFKNSEERLFSLMAILCQMPILNYSMVDKAKGKSSF